MAALGKIRSRGGLLIGIIALGLFAFIAEEMVRSCETTKNDQRQQVGEVLGEKINFQEFQKLVDENTEIIKMQQGTENLNEDQLNQVKDMVWSTYVQTKIIEKEAKELGLTVTDGELQNILKQGTNPLLMNTPFINQQTGRFDVNQLQKFLAEYKAQQGVNPQMAQQYNSLYKYWNFIEKTLRQQTLAQKYQALLGSCFISNAIEAKASFKEENEEAQVELAALPYSSIDDSKVTIEKSDLKAKYNELKPRFEQFVEARDIKYIDIEVVPSAADRAAIKKDFEACRAARTTIENIVFEPEVGALYYGKVVRIIPIGAFIELAPGKDGMCHIKDLEFKRTEKVEDVLNVGDMTWVKVTEIDDRGRVNLSRKEALKERGEA